MNPDRKPIKRQILRWSAGAVLVLLGIVAAIIIVRAFSARRMADLQTWHTVTFDAEFNDQRDGDRISFDTYLEIEARLFEELDRRIGRRVEPDTVLSISRFFPGGVNNPDTFPKNWNRTFEMLPANVQGGALLLHGLTDSPYSLSHVARLLSARNFYVLGLRLPGHGTAPAGIRSATQNDWMAAVRIGVRRVRSVAGADKPFLMVGYSNGGALTLRYTLEAMTDNGLAMPDQLILLSPAVAVTPFGALADWHKTLSFLPFFRKFRWQNIDPEYDPFKYNSFPKHAGRQTYLLTRAVQHQLQALAESKTLVEFPPVMTFQSLVDATVITDAIVTHLYNRLDNSLSELVLFDINRQSDVRSFIKSETSRLLERLEQRSDLPYRLTVITNESATSRDVVARTRASRSPDIKTEPLDLRWPAGVYSLSHVAIPFPTDDALYGLNPPRPQPYGVNLGAIEPRGEKGLLNTSFEQLMRLRSNPFFPYVEQRIVKAVNRLLNTTEAKREGHD